MQAEFTIKRGLLGDSCICEPALNACGLRRGGPVRVHVADPAVRPLYENHPVIRLADEPGSPVMDESDAFWWAIRHERYFAAGFWPQVGLEDGPAPGERLHFKVHGSPIARMTDAIVLCPFSRACSGNKGDRPNKAVSVKWWEDVFKRLVINPHQNPHDPPIISLGSHDDPKVAGTINGRHGTLARAASLILSARLLITVETWANIVAGGKTIGRTLFMSSATPLSFIQPPGSEVVRAPWPDEWDKYETIEKIIKLLKETERCPEVSCSSPTGTV